MTLRAISIAPNNYENPIESDRTLFDTLAGRVAGVVFEAFSASQSAAPELKVVPGVGHTVKVQPGKAVIREKSNPQWRGGYWLTNDADEVVNLPVPQSNPFIATVVARVADPQYGAVTGAVGPRIDVISGTTASNPVAVSDAEIDAVAGTPGGWERLSDVRINTADTGAIPAGQFADRRTPGGFGAINCWSANRPIVSGSGIEIFEMDTKASGRWDGVAWVMYDNVWQSYTPTMYVGSNPISNPGNAVIDFKYLREGRKVTLQAFFKLGSTTSYGGVGILSWTYPPGLVAKLQSDASHNVYSGAAHVQGAGAANIWNGFPVHQRSSQRMIVVKVDDLVLQDGGLSAAGQWVNWSTAYEIA